MWWPQEVLWWDMSYIWSVHSAVAILWRVHCHFSEVDVHVVSPWCSVSLKVQRTQPLVFCVHDMKSYMCGNNLVYNPVPLRSRLIRQRGVGDVFPISCPLGIWVFDNDSNQRHILSSSCRWDYSPESRDFHRRKRCLRDCSRSPRRKYIDSWGQMLLVLYWEDCPFRWTSSTVISIQPGRNRYTDYGKRQCIWVSHLLTF